MNDEMHHGQLVEQYRKLKGWSQYDLAEMLGVDVRTVQRLEKQAVIRSSNRRRFLVALLGIPAGQMALEGESHPLEEVHNFLNEDPMTFFEDQLHTRCTLEIMGGPLNAGYALGRWHRSVVDFSTSVQGTGWQPRALRVLCMSYQLKGSVASDLMSFDVAQQEYRQAFQIAKELDDHELMGAALVNHGSVFLKSKDFPKAITYYKGALDAIQGEGLPLLRGNILKALSEAYANVGQAQDCWRCIGLAGDALQQRESVQERSYRRCTPASVAASKGYDAVLLRDYERGLSLLDKSLASCDPTRIPARARWLACQAEAYYGLGTIDACAVSAEEALRLAKSVGVSVTLTRVRDLHTRLASSKWKNERWVGRLGALLATQ